MCPFSKSLASRICELCLIKHITQSLEMDTKNHLILLEDLEFLCLSLRQALFEVDVIEVLITRNFFYRQEQRQGI